MLVVEFDNAESRVIAGCSGRMNPKKWAIECVRAIATETMDEIVQFGRLTDRKEAPAAGHILAAYDKRVILSELQLSRDLFEALTAVASWEGWSFGEACRMILTSFLESSYGEILTVKERGIRRERAWAELHHSLLEPLMKNLGWNGSTIASGRNSA